MRWSKVRNSPPPRFGDDGYTYYYVSDPVFYVRQIPLSIKASLTRPLFCYCGRVNQRSGRMLNLRVLVVDEDSQSRQSIESFLTHDPFFIVNGCASGDQALSTAVEWRPDLMLLNDTATGTDAFAVLAQLRSDKRMGLVAVVLLTERMREWERCKALGATGLIAKPLETADIPAALKRFVPVEGSLAVLRESFLKRLAADASALSACRATLANSYAEPVMRRVNAIAHALAGAGGIYGFAGITCESAALATASELKLTGAAHYVDVERALDRLLTRISPN
jgi:CheY-like chemotaxis protein